MGTFKHKMALVSIVVAMETRTSSKASNGCYFPILGGLCPGGVSVQGVCVQGGLCPGGYLSRGSLSRGSVSREVSVQRVSVQGGLCARRSLPWGYM